MPARFARFLRIMTFVAPCAVVLAGVFVSPWPVQRFLIFYVAPLLLAVLLWTNIRMPGYLNGLNILSLLDAAVLILAFVRMFGVLPFSGHMLFIAYSSLTTRVRYYRIVGIALALETTAFKLLLWHDVASWALGLLLGVLMALLYGYMRRVRTA